MSDVAIFVEDPGAVAFIDGVPEALAKMGYTALINPPPVYWCTRPAPLAVVVGTGEDDAWPERLEAARKDGVPAIALIDSCTSVGHRSIGLDYEDWVAVPDESTRQAYGILGFANVRACGHPRHDALYAMRRRKISSVPMIMFATELSTSCDALLNGSGRTEDAIERFLAAAMSLPFLHEVVLRLHPKTPRELYTAYLDKFDEVSEGGPSSAAILAADLVVGLTSSILDEAVILGRPAITIARPEERAALAAWRHGLVPVAYDPQDIAEALQRASLPDPAAVEQAFPRGGARKVAELIADAIMAQMPTLDDGTVRLEPFADRHATERYVGWLNDPEIVRFSEQRHRAHTLESCRIYRESLNPPHKLWAIIAPPYGHVGNVSATVDKWNRVADLAILVGRRGEGIGTRAWRLALDWLLGQGGMRKVTAGTMAENEMMMGVIRNSGMSVEGRQSGRFLLEGVPVDGILAARETTA